MLFRFFQFISVSALIWTPVSAQFGLAGGNRKQATGFEDLQQAAAAAGAGTGDGGDLASLMGGNMDMGALQEMMADAMKNPEAMKQFEQLGAQFGSAMEQLSKMDPEELQKQMQDAFAMMTEGSVVDTVLEKRDEVMKTLEETGVVPAEELAKMKADPNYFDQKIKESFGQMQDLFNNPEYMKMATEALSGMGNMVNNPDALGDLASMLSPDLQDDEKIEEARLELLKNADNPLYATMFESSEMKEILNDPKAWREAVKEGYEDILNDSKVKEVKDEL